MAVPNLPSISRVKRRLFINDKDLKASTNDEILIISLLSTSKDHLNISERVKLLIPRDIKIIRCYPEDAYEACNKHTFEVILTDSDLSKTTQLLRIIYNIRKSSNNNQTAAIIAINQSASEQDKFSYGITKVYSGDLTISVIDEILTNYLQQGSKHAHAYPATNHEYRTSQIPTIQEEKSSTTEKKSSDKVNVKQTTAKINVTIETSTNQKQTYTVSTSNTAEDSYISKSDQIDAHPNVAKSPQVENCISISKPPQVSNNANVTKPPQDNGKPNVPNNQFVILRPIPHRSYNYHNSLPLTHQLHNLPQNYPKINPTQGNNYQNNGEQFVAIQPSTQQSSYQNDQSRNIILPSETSAKNKDGEHKDSNVSNNNNSIKSSQKKENTDNMIQSTNEHMNVPPYFLFQPMQQRPFHPINTPPFMYPLLPPGAPQNNFYGNGESYPLHYRMNAPYIISGEPGTMGMRMSMIPEDATTHSNKERQRRERIKDACDQIRELLPKSASKNKKIDMAKLLELTVVYIKLLHSTTSTIVQQQCGRVYDHFYQQQQHLHQQQLLQQQQQPYGVKRYFNDLYVDDQDNSLPNNKKPLSMNDNANNRNMIFGMPPTSNQYVQVTPNTLQQQHFTDGTHFPLHPEMVDMSNAPYEVYQQPSSRQNILQNATTSNNSPNDVTPNCPIDVKSNNNATTTTSTLHHERNYEQQLSQQIQNAATLFANKPPGDSNNSFQFEKLHHIS